MKLQKKNKSFNFNLSVTDYDKLKELADEQKMKPAELMRTLIQVTWIAKNSEKISKQGKVKIGGYGITFPPEIFEDFTKTLENAFTEFDWKSLEDKITITGERHYRPKNP